MSSTNCNSRHLVHVRSINVRGYRRDDGKWDVEGRLTDTKSYDIEGLYRKHIPSGEPIHDMRVTVTVDDDLVIDGVEARIDFAPFPMCGDIVFEFSRLKGLNLGRGFMKEVRSRFSGRDGCTHLVELLGGIATTAFQTIYPVLRSERGEPEGKPALIDSCHAFSAEGEVVAKTWPAYSTRSR